MKYIYKVNGEETEKGVEIMCRELKELYEEGYSEGMENGELKKAKEMAISLYEMNFSVEKIAQVLKMSEHTVQEWLDESFSVVN